MPKKQSVPSALLVFRDGYAAILQPEPARRRLLEMEGAGYIVFRQEAARLGRWWLTPHGQSALDAFGARTVVTANESGGAKFE